MDKEKGSRLRDKVAIITGGAQGIGQAFCLGFANEGAKVVVADINLPMAEATAKKISENGNEALPLRIDVSQVEDTLQMAEKTIEHFEHIDILLNNAAIFGRVRVTRGPFYDINLDEWDQMMKVNLKGPFLCIRAVFPYMKQQNRGKIINMASNTIFKGVDTIPHYVASKSGLVGFSRSITETLGEFNININCIAPGRTFSEDTDDQAALKVNQQFIGGRVFKRLEYPEDLVGTAIFLASPDSDFITGQTIVVDGGQIQH